MGVGDEAAFPLEKIECGCRRCGTEVVVVAATLAASTDHITTMIKTPMTAIRNTAVNGTRKRPDQDSKLTTLAKNSASSANVANLGGAPQQQACRYCVLLPTAATKPLTGWREAAKTQGTARGAGSQRKGW